MEPQTSGEKAPTHKPVIEKTETGIRIKVGSVPHVMDPDHYIPWIEVEKDGKTTRKDLKPGDKPEAEFELDQPDLARAFCTTHGLWETTI